MLLAAPRLACFVVRSTATVVRPSEATRWPSFSEAADSARRHLADAVGNLVERKDNSADVAAWTLYAGGVAELHSDGSQTHNYSAFGRVIAMEQLPAGAGPGVVSSRSAGGRRIAPPTLCVDRGVYATACACTASSARCSASTRSGPNRRSGPVGLMSVKGDSHRRAGDMSPCAVT